MSGFVPLFSQMLWSSLWREPDDVRLVFITLLALKDKGHRVMNSAYGIGVACWPGDEDHAEERALKALKTLSEPDTRRRLVPQQYEGRRIEAIEGGWRILNGERYQELMRLEFRRAQQAKWMREKREKLRLKSGQTLAERNAVNEERSVVES